MNEDGSQPKKRSWAKIGCLSIIGLFAAMIAGGYILQQVDPEGVKRRAAEQDASTAKAEADERMAKLDGATKVTSLALSQAYQANEVAAQQAYGDRPLLVTGTVTGVSLDFADNPVVQLNSENEFLSVQASLDDANAAAAMQKGQSVTLLCEKVIEVVSAPQLRDCSIVE